MAERGALMKPKNEANVFSITIGIVCIVLAIVGAASLHRILPDLNGWQAVAYSVVGGIFIAVIGVIVNSICSFYLDD